MIEKVRQKFIGIYWDQTSKYLNRTFSDQSNEILPVNESINAKFLDDKLEEKIQEKLELRLEELEKKFIEKNLCRHPRHSKRAVLQVDGSLYITHL